jgi:UDP:flavonoid glycosyltransferase YjiC (YdhE family)
MVPQGADHFWNAEACSQAGAGTMVEAAELSPASIGEAVRLVLENHHYAHRANDLADEIAAMPSPRDCLGSFAADGAGV